MNAAVELPTYVALTCYVCLLMAGIFIYLSAKKNKLSSAVWLLTLGLSVAISGLLPLAMEIPDVQLVSFAPALILLLAVFSERWSRLSEDFEDAYAHYFHLWRLPASFIPLWLYQSGVVPIQVTFEGLNLDIIAGLTAPVLSSLAFSQQMLGRTVVLVWNVLAALLLLTSTWLVYSEMIVNTQLMELYKAMPFSSLIFALTPLSFSLHILAVWRILKGKMQLTD